MHSGSERKGAFVPAAYGRSCLACARAKCKCFYQPQGASCERCDRLGKQCEPGTASRKRKAASPQPQRLPPETPSMAPSHLENKLDDLVSLLRVQVEKQAQQFQLTPQSVSEGTPPSARLVIDSGRHPEVLVDIENSTVHLLRSDSPPREQSCVLEDVLVHHIPDHVAHEQLATFHRAFLPMFPFIHIPGDMTSTQLRLERPFLWLNIMALTTVIISQQFAMEETIWKIISQRVVVQHYANMDLLLGIICFASWSHYFKKDKPFMTMLAQLAVSLSFELGLQAEVPMRQKRRSPPSMAGDQQIKRRSLEEKRSFLAVFHLTSATWAAYRKTEPLRWSPYLDTCLQAISGNGTRPDMRLDAILAAQVKCQLIYNDLLSNSYPGDSSVAADATSNSTILTTALLRQLNDVRQGLPPEVRSLSTIQFYLYNTELSIREIVLRSAPNKMVLADVQRLKDLDFSLTAIEGWLHTFSNLPSVEMIGIHVDNFTQFLHCIVVLFKLSTLEETGWDLEEVKRRADIFDIMDSTGRQIKDVAGANNMVNADGPRSGLFFKSKCLWDAIKALLQTEMAAHLGKPADATLGEAAAPQEDEQLMNDFLMNLADEPWLSDIFTYDWIPEISFDVP